MRKKKVLANYTVIAKSALPHPRKFQSTSLVKASARHAVPPDEIKVQCEGGLAGPSISSSLAPAQPTLTIALPPNPHAFLVPAPFFPSRSCRFAERLHGYGSTNLTILDS